MVLHEDKYLNCNRNTSHSGSNIMSSRNDKFIINYKTTNCISRLIGNKRTKEEEVI